MTKVQDYTEEMTAWIVERQLAGESSREIARGLVDRFKLNYDSGYMATKLRRDAPVFAERLAAGYTDFMEKQLPEVREAFNHEPLALLTISEACRVLGRSPLEGQALLWLMVRNPKARHLDYFRYLASPIARLTPRVVQLVIMGREANQTGEEIRTTVFNEARYELSSSTVPTAIIGDLRTYGYTVPESKQSIPAQRKAQSAERKAATKKAEAPLAVSVAKPVVENLAPVVPTKNSNMPEPREPPPPSRDREGIPFSALRNSETRKQCRFPLWNHTERLPLEQLRFCGTVHTNKHAYCAECAKGLFVTRPTRLR